jgi:hypothetical protein
VLYLALLLLLTFLVLAALLWGGTRLIQAALYETGEPDLYWRAPAAAAAMAAFFGAWALLNYRAAEPGQAELPYDGLFNFTAEQVSERPVPEFWVLHGEGQMRYVARDLGGMPPRREYRGEDGQVWQAERAADGDTIVIREGKDKTPVRFKAVMPSDPKKDRHVERYVEEGGRRYLDGETFGRNGLVMTPRGGGSFVRVTINVLHFVLWFDVLWLLLRFQWPHALGLAAALWLVMTFVAPYLFREFANVKAARATAAQTVNRMVGPAHDPGTGNARPLS